MKKLFTQKFCIYCSLVVFLTLFASLSVMAQSKPVSGVITDSNNQPIAGASVMVKNTSVGAAANVRGEYTINAPADGTLVFSSLGYSDHEVRVNGRTTIDVTMDAISEDTQLEEVVVVGYGTQKKVTVTGAVAGVKGSEMLQTKNENPQNMLTGRVAGLRVWQKSAEPGSYNNNFDIRGYGAPLVVIDGIPRTGEEFQRLNPNDIEDVSVLKDGAAAIYGVRAANGVVLVTTKKGEKGKSSVSYSGSFTMQQPSKMPEHADAYQSMTLYNESTMNRITGGFVYYPESMFEQFRSGARRTTDWNSLVMSKISPQTEHNLNISGGTDKTQYFMSMGYFFQEGFFKSGDLNYNKFNVRSNVTTEIAKGLKFGLNLSAIADQSNNPYSPSDNIIRNYWRQGVLWPAYADPDNTMLNYEGLDLMENTVAKMTADVSGYRKYEKKFFQSSAELNYDFGTATPVLRGLTAKAMVGFDYRMDNNTKYRKEYSLYAYDADNDTYTQRLYAESSPSNVRREFYDKRQVLSQITLNYNRTFAGKHNVSGLVGWETQKRTGDNFYAMRDLAFAMDYLFAGVADGQVGSMSSSTGDLYEEGNEALIGRVNYVYDNRYIVEGQFRYDGSSKFAKGHQWGFFPSASVGWRVSEEPFFKDSGALSFVNQLKVRASYGVMGDDGSLAYDWATGYQYPSTSGNADKGYYNQYAPGYIFDGVYTIAANPIALPNQAITWYTSHSFNVGIDFEGWNGLFGFSVDYFDRRRDGLFARATGDLPTVIGATAPRENLNSDRRFGIDLELNHRNVVGEFRYKVKGIATITRNQYKTAVQNGPYGNSYDKWRNDNLNNRYQGVQFGYEGAGRYQNWYDIRTYQIQKGNDVLPGDYKYKDWNGDGVIDGLDEHPFAYDQTPWMNYSLNFDCSYKNFDFNMLLQGSALGSMEYKEPLYAIWGVYGGGSLVQYLDRWHPTAANVDPYDPSLTWNKGYYGFTGHYPRSNSDFNRVSTAYLRLKSIELGYTIPKIAALSTMKLRVYANAYNLLTFTGVKFVDPEHPDDDLGRLYPLNKTYTLGLSLTF